MHARRSSTKWLCHHSVRRRSWFRADSITVSLGAGAAATAVSRLIGLARTTALAWLIPQTQFGLFGVALLVVNVLMPLCSLGLYEGIMRFAPLHEAAGTLRRFIFRSGAWLVGLTAGAVLVLLAFAEPCGAMLFTALDSAAEGAVRSDPLAWPSHLWPMRLMRATLLCVVALALYQSLIGLLKGLRMFRATAAAEVATALLFTVLALGGARAGFTSAPALIVTYAIACVAVVLVLTPGLILRLSAATQSVSSASSVSTAPPVSPAPLSLRAPTDAAPRRRRDTADLLHYSLWVAGAAMAWQALSYFPMWYLLKVSNGETVGAFHAVRTVTQLVQVGASVVTGVVAAHVTRIWEQQGPYRARPHLTVMTKGSLLLFLVCANMVALFRPWVMRLFPSTFAPGASAYDPLVLFFALVGVVGLVAVRLSLVKRTRLTFLAWLVGAMVNVIAAYLWIRPEGTETGTPTVGALSAAAWAGVTGALAALIACLVLTKRRALGLDGRTLLLMGTIMTVGLGWTVSVPVLGLALAAAGTPGLIFSVEEHVTLRRQLERVFRR